MHWHDGEIIEINDILTEISPKMIRPDHKTHILDQRDGLLQGMISGGGIFGTPKKETQLDQWDGEITSGRKDLLPSGLETPIPHHVYLFRFHHSGFERMDEVREILHSRNLRSATIEELVAFRYQKSEAIRDGMMIVCPGIIHLTPISPCHDGSKQPRLLTLSRTGSCYFLNASPHVNGGCPGNWHIMAAKI